MNDLAGKVAFISGAARGQGRSHALRLAERGADIIAFDICEQIDTVEYPMATPADLGETVAMVEKLNRRIVATHADVRDEAAVRAVLEDGLTAFGRVDIVLANAGIMTLAGPRRDSPAAYLDAIDVNLNGVVNTIEPTIDALIGQGDGGAIVITSSVAGLKGMMPDSRTRSRGLLGYIASKHGTVGVMRAYANALAEHRIRVNSVHPTGVNSPMAVNEAFGRFAQENPAIIESMQNALPVPMVECSDVTEAVLWLCSDAARYVTGMTLTVDAGCTIR